jgi:hypothetical protein
VPRYRPWKAGAEALAEIGIGGLPDDWPRTRGVWLQQHRPAALVAAAAGTGAVVVGMEWVIGCSSTHGVDLLLWVRTLVRTLPPMTDGTVSGAPAG